MGWYIKGISTVVKSPYVTLAIKGGTVQLHKPSSALIVASRFLRYVETHA